MATAVKRPFSASQQTGLDSKVLDGRKCWVMRFEPDQLPMITEFWTVTMYKLPERLLVKDPLNHYSIGDRTPGLKLGPMDPCRLTSRMKTQAPTRPRIGCPHQPGLSSSWRVCMALRILF